MTTVIDKPNILNTNQISFEERQKQLENEENKEYLEQEKIKKGPYSNFVQVNRDMYKAEDWLMKNSPVAYRIFRFLVNNMDAYNAVICSYQVIMEALEIGQATVARAIKLLKDRQYIEIYKTGTSNVYSINKNLVWSSWGSNYKYAKFGANIILSENEQKENNIQIEKQKIVTLKESDNKIKNKN